MSIIYNKLSGGILEKVKNSPADEKRAYFLIGQVKRIQKLVCKKKCMKN